MRTGARAFLRFVVVALLCSRPTEAQERPGGARLVGIPLGPVTLAPWFELRDVGMDTNILHETGARVPDSVATGVAHLTASMHTPTVGVEAISAVGFDYFARYRDQRSLNRDHRLRLTARTGPVTLSATGTILDTRERLNLDLDSRLRRTETGVSFGTAVRLSPKTAIDADVRRSDVGFDGQASIGGLRVGQVMQHRTDAAAVRLRYSMTRLTTLGLQTDVERTRFPEAPGRDSDSFRVMPAIEFQPQALVAGTASFGYQSFRPLTETFPRFKGVVGLADVSLPVAPATRLQLGAERDFDYSYQVATPVFVLTAVRGALIHRLGSRWEVALGTSRERLAYRSVAQPTGDGDASGPARVDHFSVFRASTGYQVTRFLRIGMRSEYFRRRSDLGTRRYEQFRMGVTVQYGFLPATGVRQWSGGGQP